MKTLLTIALAICFIGCTKDGPVGPAGKDGAQDKRIIYYFTFPITTFDTTGYVYANLVKFDKRDFVGVDSIILVANPTVEDKGSPDTYCLIDMYNLTDNIPIANSLVSSNRPNDSLYNAIYKNGVYTSNMYLQSGNFFSALPNKEINLGIRLRTSKQGVMAYGGHSYYIILYRR